MAPEQEDEETLTLPKFNVLVSIFAMFIGSIIVGAIVIGVSCFISYLVLGN